jgi:hypothetical protein
MAGLVPAISISYARRSFLSEIAGTSPAMTNASVVVGARKLSLRKPAGGWRKDPQRCAYADGITGTSK